MTPVFSVRRRAEEFNTLVEDASTGGSRDAWLADGLDLVAMMRDLAPAEPSAAFTASLREDLMAAADSLLLPSDDTQRLSLPPRRAARDRRIAAAVGGFAIVGASTSLAVAASSALPGEMLYPLKRAMESAETGIQVSDEATGISLLANANDRLAEVTALSRTSNPGEGAMIAETLTTFSEQALRASDLMLADYAADDDDAPVERLREFASTSMETLTRLEGMVPEEARDELVQAARVLGEIDAAAEQACPACSGGITQIPSILVSAGQLAERPVVVVPAPLVEEDPPRNGPQPDDHQDPSQNHGPTAGPGDDPLTDPPISPDDTGSGTGEDPTSPLDVTAPLTDQGGGNTSNGGGLTDVPEVPDVPDVIEDVIDDTLPVLP